MTGGIVIGFVIGWLVSHWFTQRYY